MNFDQLKDITLTFLTELSKFADEVIEPMTLSGMRRRVNYPDWDNRKFDSNVRSLEYRGYVIINRKNDSIELTNKGRIKLIENSTDKTIDGRWRFLSWDIPEKYCVKRQFLCRSVRRIGYRQVQKSLWACPFAKADDVDLIINDLKLEKYVAFFIVEKTDIENHLKKLFPQSVQRSSKKRTVI